jgi:nucleotide-binding universal stress UspA family protein
MFRKILVPVDLTEANRSAIEIAQEMAERVAGTVTLLHVIETIADVPFEDMQDFYRRLEEKARAGMGDLAQPLGADDVALDQQVVYGKRAPEIVAFAQERKTDLIVLSSHPLDPENPGAVWGSISHQVAILAPCPVLLLKS